MSTPKVSYYVKTATATNGPFSITQLRGMWCNGAITAADLFCISGQSDWHPLSMLQNTLEAPAQVPTVRTPRVVIIKAPSVQPPQASPGVAAVLSFFIPGLGQLYRGRMLAGLLSFLFVAMLYASPLLFVGLFLHFVVVVDAGATPTARSADSEKSVVGLIFLILALAGTVIAILMNMKK